MLFKALMSRGLQIPTALKTLKAGDQVTADRIKWTCGHDQILHLPTALSHFTNSGGTLSSSVTHRRETVSGKNYTREKFTFRCPTISRSGSRSTDIDGERLNQIVQDLKKGQQWWLYRSPRPRRRAPCDRPSRYARLRRPRTPLHRPRVRGMTTCCRCLPNGAFRVAEAHERRADYSPTAMAVQQRDLATFAKRPAAIDPSGWPIPQQVDYHVVRGR
jgi:hypothetical protein